MRWLCLLVSLAACSEPAPPIRAAGALEAPAERSVESPDERAEPREAPAARVRLSGAGDLVLNPHAMRSIADDGPDGYSNLLVGYRAAIREDEIAFVNLEQPLVDDVVELDPGWPRQDPSRPRRSPILGATPPLADALAEAGVDVAGLANNHAYDQGRDGLRRTLEELARVGIDPVGAAESTDAAFAPTIVEREGHRVAFVGFSEFFNQRARDGSDYAAARLADDERVRRAIVRAREEADVVVVAVHWSRDFLTEPRPSERRLARELVEMGADIIWGTGPHVLHPVERVESARGEALIAYSLGNVASGMGRTYRLGHPPTGFMHPANVTPEARDGAVIHVELDLSDGVRIVELTVEPLWTDNNWLAHRRDDVPHRIRVFRLADTDEATRAERGPIIAAALALP